MARPLPLAHFLVLRRWVQQQGGPGRRPQRGHRPTPGADEGFILTLADGRPAATTAGRGRGRHRRSSTARGVRLPPELASHTGAPRPQMFCGRAVLVVGGGQSALESAALMHESGAEVEVVVRRHTSTGCTAASTTASSAVAPRVYAPTDVGPMGLSRIVAVPDASAGSRARCRTRWRTARSARRARPGWCPGSSTFRSTSVGCERAATVGPGVRVELDDGRNRDVDHVMFGTGYRVDVARYPFLDGRRGAGQARRRLSRAAGGDGVIGAGLHFLGAPAAWSFGPIMRFVAGGWFGGRSLTQAVTRGTTLDAPRPHRQVFRPATGGPRDARWRRRSGAAVARRWAHWSSAATTRGWALRAAWGGTAFRCASSTMNDRSRVRPSSSSGSCGCATSATPAPPSTCSSTWNAIRPQRLGGVPDPRGDGRGDLATPRRTAGCISHPHAGLGGGAAGWDKRQTYRVGEALGIAMPRTWFPADEDELRALDLPGPVIVKPAIKEHFFYATRAKAWRADDRTQLLDAYRNATRTVGDPGEVMVQELIRGDGDRQVAYCAFFKEGAPIAGMTVRRRRQHPSDFGRASTYVETVDCPSSRSCRSDSSGRSATTAWPSWSTSRIRATAPTSCSTSTPAPGATTHSAAPPGSTSRICFTATRPAFPSRRRSRARACAGSG